MPATISDPHPSPVLSKIRLHPIKSLDPVEVPAARIGSSGGLDLDRVWALYAQDGHWINGKRTSAIHGIRAAFAADFSTVELFTAPGRAEPAPVSIAFPGDTKIAGEWFSQYFGEPVTVGYAEQGFPDDDAAPGPTIVSTASLEMIRQWFPSISLDEARRRFRTTLEINGVPAFWEDRLFTAEKDGIIRFRVGDVWFDGSNPCARCAVPPRDSLTGEAIDGFQKHFAEMRRLYLPEWSPASRFDHFYRLAVNTRVPAAEAGKLLRVGDRVTLS